jgi:hypothetical protein
VFIKRKALTRDYEETVQTIMKKADPKTQNTIKDLLRLMANE